MLPKASKNRLWGKVEIGVPPPPAGNKEGALKRPGEKLLYLWDSSAFITVYKQVSWNWPGVGEKPDRWGSPISALSPFERGEGIRPNSPPL